MHRPSIIALLTDFGLSDSYVASIKGVILSSVPTAQIIDITHDIPPQDVNTGAYVLWSCYRFFPAGTIFIAVVDPGVGTERAIIGISEKKYTFLAPDNGLLRFILGSLKTPQIVQVSNSKYFRRAVSRTFHGRDIFAPVAAHLVSGVDFSALGPRVEPETKPHRFQLVNSKRTHEYEGEVIHIDHFGNVVTDFMVRRDVPKSVTLQIGRRVIMASSRTYGKGSSTQPFLIVGSTGLIEISLKNGNTAKKLHAFPGQGLTLRV